MGSDNTSPQLTPKVSLLELAKVFIVIGTIGFGGGMAIVALIQDYVVNKRKWMDLDEYTHGVALGQVMGAFAVNITIFVGYRIRGLKGAIVAATTFLAPSIVLVIALTALYTRFHNVQSFQYALKGIAPVVVAIILAAAYQMGRNKVKSPESIILLVAAVLLVGVLKVQIVFVLLGAAAYALVKLRWFKKEVSNAKV